MHKVNKSSYIAKGGLFTAVGVILVYLSTIIPVNKLFLLVIASCIIPLCVIDSGLKSALTVYVSTSLLSLLIGGIKSSVILYIIFFGLYGIVKYYIEKLRKLCIELLLKLVFFNSCIVFMYLTYRLFVTNLFKFKIPFYWILILMQIVFILYDYAVTLFINYVYNRFHKKRY